MITDRTSATEAEFAARVAPIESAPDAEESAVERVARAIGHVAYNGFPWAEMDEFEREEYRAQAHAALVAMQGPESPVVAAMLTLAEEWATGPFADAVVFVPAACAAELRATLAAALRPDAAAPEVQR